MTANLFLAALERGSVWTLSTGMETNHQVPFEVQPLSVRYERKYVGYGLWWNRASDYYKNVRIDGGFLVIQGRKIPLEVLPE